MRLGFTAIAMATALLGGCASQFGDATPERRQAMLQDFRDGKAELTCRIACQFTYSRALSSLHVMHQTQDWAGLSENILRIGYSNDLSYYYLGRAAEGLGYPRAALRYYQISGGIATGDERMAKCAASAECNGIELPRALQPRMAMINAQLTPRRAVPRVAAADEWVEPPPVAR